MNSLQNSISITTQATLGKKMFLFLELAWLVLRQRNTFFPQITCVSLRKRVLQGVL